MGGIFEIILNKNLFNHDNNVYKHILNIPKNICREKLFHDNLHFNIIILTEDEQKTFDEVMNGVRLCDNFYLNELRKCNNH